MTRTPSQPAASLVEQIAKTIEDMEADLQALKEELKRAATRPSDEYLLAYA